MMKKCFYFILKFFIAWFKNLLPQKKKPEVAFEKFFENLLNPKCILGFECKFLIITVFLSNHNFSNLFLVFIRVSYFIFI